MRRRREMMPGGETPTPRRGRISGREMLARRKTSAATLRKRGGGVSESRRGPPCNLHMVSCAEFFRSFDFRGWGPSNILIVNGFLAFDFALKIKEATQKSNESAKSSSCAGPQCGVGADCCLEAP